MIATKDLALMAICGAIDGSINYSVSKAKKVAQKVSKIFPGKRNDNANLLRQFSLQWIIHNVPLKDGIQLSYEEFRSAIKRFGRYYNEGSLEQQLKEFYDTATNVWQKFKKPPSTEEIKHALLEIAAKSLDKDHQKKYILKNDIGFGEGLFKIAKQFYEEKKQMSENTLIKNVFESFEGMLEQENNYVEVCKDYYSFLKDFINVHFPTKLKKDERLYKKMYVFILQNYLKLVGFPLFSLEDIMDFFLSESTQKIVENNFHEKRLEVQNNQGQLLQLQVQILGIKGFLIWKRFFNAYKVYRGFSIFERIQLLGVQGLLNEVKQLVPTIIQDNVVIKKFRDFYQIKVKKTLVKNYKYVDYYHGVMNKEWIIFKIKTLNQFKDLLKALSNKVELINHRANKLYQEALEYVQKKRKQILEKQKEEINTQRDCEEDKDEQVDQGVASPVMNKNQNQEYSYNEEEKNNNDNSNNQKSLIMEKVAESAVQLDDENIEDSQIKNEANQNSIKKVESTENLNQNQQQQNSSEEDNPAVTVSSLDSPQKQDSFQSKENQQKKSDEKLEEEEEKHQNSEEKDSSENKPHYYVDSEKKNKQSQENDKEQTTPQE